MIHKHATDFENLLADDKARKARMDAIHQESLDRIRKDEGPIGQEDPQLTLVQKVREYLIYEMPLGVWVAAYVVLALIVVSLLS